MYTFGGWDKKVSTVKGNETYKAVFNKYKISESKKINVYLIAGDSNAVGYGKDSSCLLEYSDARFVNGFDSRKRFCISKQRLQYIKNTWS
jgi:hypothetical protein